MFSYWLRLINWVMISLGINGLFSVFLQYFRHANTHYPHPNPGTYLGWSWPGKRGRSCRRGGCILSSGSLHIEPPPTLAEFVGEPIMTVPCLPPLTSLYLPSSNLVSNGDAWHIRAVCSCTCGPTRLEATEPPVTLSPRLKRDFSLCWLLFHTTHSLLMWGNCICIWSAWSAWDRVVNPWPKTKQKVCTTEVIHSSLVRTFPVLGLIKLFYVT